MRTRRQQCLNFVRYINKRDSKSNVSYKKAWDLFCCFFCVFPSLLYMTKGKYQYCTNHILVLYCMYVCIVCGQFPLKKCNDNDINAHLKVYVIFLRNNSSCESMRFIELVAKFFMFFLPLHQRI